MKRCPVLKYDESGYVENTKHKRGHGPSVKVLGDIIA